MKYIIIISALVGAIKAASLQDEAVQEFERGNRLLTAAIYKELVNRNAGNLVVSPFSVETILSLAYEGARGKTAMELVNGLYLPNTDEKVQAAYRSVLPKLQSISNDLELLSANKIYLREDAVLEERFKSIASRVYRSGVQNVDFSRNMAAANEINAWVEEQTNSKIRNLVDPQAINENTIMVLVNTLYLSGKWASPFSNYGWRGNFYTANGNAVQADIMWLQEYLNYWENENLNAQFVELPLQGANISMIIALPKEIDGLASLEENIEQVLQPRQSMKQLVEVELPRFSVESKIQFLPILENLGIRRAFGPGADLSGISSTDQNFYISDVIQKSFINVTETGIEAAAATEISGLKSSLEFPTASLRANRPFLYYIRNNGVVLFSGRYVNPEE